VSRYGIIDAEQTAERTYRVRGLVEKPPLEEAPSRLAIMGRYILTPEVFDTLEKVKPGAVGEIQLTDGINALLETQAIFAYEFASASRIVYMNRPDFESPIPSWMGHSLGRLEGDSLVIDVTDQVPDTWFDHAGNHHSDALQVTERYTHMGPNVLMYEATLEDPNTYTQPWSIRFPLYRRLDENMQLLEFNCVEFSEEMLYGHLRKQSAE
ncbi:MAG: hypothetical protein IIC82_09600, partial [Chloroflexi bacterium]|nr:hypothetical protein [Chloroflexota bacterium]